MKPAERETPTRRATVCGKPSRWCGQSVQILLNYVGCEARKLPAGGEVFFLDFSFYRANRTFDVPGLYLSGFRVYQALAQPDANPCTDGYLGTPPFVLGVSISVAVTCAYWRHGTRIHFLSLRPKHTSGPSVGTA